MLNKLYLILIALLVVSCATPKMIMVGNVTLRDRKGDVVSYYPRAHILDQVGEGDQISTIQFISQDGLKHYVDGGYISVDAIEYIQQRNNHTYVVIDNYPYWYNRPYVITYPYRPYYVRPAPMRVPPSRPVPRSNNPRR